MLDTRPAITCDDGIRTARRTEQPVRTIKVSRPRKVAVTGTTGGSR
ncbi:hypothetical protein ACFFMR_33050 [Micromonospora andamanensis]|nr:hypothetical protein [Micromonospora andamanensis]